jgi:hypothetical protein
MKDIIDLLNDMQNEINQNPILYQLMLRIILKICRNRCKKMQKITFPQIYDTNLKKLLELLKTATTFIEDSKHYLNNIHINPNQLFNVYEQQGLYKIKSLIYDLENSQNNYTQEEINKYIEIIMNILKKYTN